MNSIFKLILPAAVVYLILVPFQIILLETYETLKIAEGPQLTDPYEIIEESVVLPTKRKVCKFTFHGPKNVQASWDSIDKNLNIYYFSEQGVFTYQAEKEYKDIIQNLGDWVKEIVDWNLDNDAERPWKNFSKKLVDNY